MLSVCPSIFPTCMAWTSMTHYFTESTKSDQYTDQTFKIILSTIRCFGFMVHGMHFYPRINLIFYFSTPCQSTKTNKWLMKQSVCYSDAIFYCYLQCSLKMIELVMGRGLRTINIQSGILNFEYFNVYYALIYRSRFINLSFYEISTYIMSKKTD